MSRTISEVEATLRLSKAAPTMAVAIEQALPRMRRYYDELQAAALVTGKAVDCELADVWFTVVLMHEHALQEARGFRCVPRSVSVSASEIWRVK